MNLAEDQDFVYIERECNDDNWGVLSGQTTGTNETEKD